MAEILTKQLPLTLVFQWYGLAKNIHLGLKMPQTGSKIKDDFWIVKTHRAKRELGVRQFLAGRPMAVEFIQHEKIYKVLDWVQVILGLTRLQYYTYWHNKDIGLIWHNISRINLWVITRLNLCTIIIGQLLSNIIQKL